MKEKIDSIVGRKNTHPTGIENVLTIRKTLFSWSLRGFENKKQALLNELWHHYKNIYIWLDDWNDDLLTLVKFEADPHRPIHQFPREYEVVSFYNQLYKGKWQLFFSNQLLLLDDKHIDFAKGPVETKALLNKSGAEIVIVSWYDDREWFIAWT